MALVGTPAVVAGSVGNSLLDRFIREVGPLPVALSGLARAPAAPLAGRGEITAFLPTVSIQALRPRASARENTAHLASFFKKKQNKNFFFLFPRVAVTQCRFGVPSHAG